MSTGAKTHDPGNLPLRMEVLEPTKVSDGLGGATVTYGVKRSAWGGFEADKLALDTSANVTNPLARGTVRMRLGLAPPVSWRLRWSALGAPQTFEVLALQRGTSAGPFDLCSVQEVAA